MRRLAGPVLVLLVASQGGCAKKLLRENVLATTQSMYGLAINQNAQTQMYEFKLGYARNELFLVPTSKRVINDRNDDDAAGTRTDYAGYPAWLENSDPSRTPEVLAEIQVGGSGKQGQGSQDTAVKVYQRLAVGKMAVDSDAAIALMANDPTTAANAKRAPEDTPSAPPTKSREEAISQVNRNAGIAYSLLTSKGALATDEGGSLDTRGKVREYVAGKVDPVLPYSTLLTSGTLEQLQALAVALEDLVERNS